MATNPKATLRGGIAWVQGYALSLLFTPANRAPRGIALHPGALRRSAHGCGGRP